MKIGRILKRASMMASFGMASCSWLAPKDGFQEVQRNARDRIGLEVELMRNANDERRLADHVKEKLKDELTPDTSIEIALINNRHLQAVYRNLGISEAEVVQASLLPNPILDGSLLTTNDGPDPEIELALVQNFVQALTIPIRRRIAEAHFDAIKIHVTQEVLALAAETKAQFYIVQSDEQMLEMLRQVLSATEASLDGMRKLREAGNVRKLDVDHEALLHGEAKLEYAAAEITARKNRERLNILMGLWGEDIQFKLSTRMPEIPETEISGEKIEKRVVEKNLDLAALSAEITVLEKSLNLTRATALFPEAGVGAAYKREPDGNHLAGPAISIPIPFFDFGRSRVATARLRLQHVRDEHYHRAVETRAAARAAWDHLQIARARAEYSRDVMLPLQHRILNETQLEYNAMQVGVFELLRAKRDEIGAGKHYIEHLRDYWLARTEMDSLLSGHITSVGFETTVLDSTMGSALH